MLTSLYERMMLRRKEEAKSAATRIEEKRSKNAGAPKKKK